MASNLTPLPIVSPINKEESLQCKAEKLYIKIEIKDRKYKLKTYKHCFIGKEAVSLIIELKIASNKTEAIEFGDQLINSNLIRHVTNDHMFKNEELFYTFTDKFYIDKKRNTTHLTPYNYTNKVSFMIEKNDPAGFSYSPTKEKSYLSRSGDDKHWNSFGSLSKSEFSFLSDRSSFAASLNTLSDNNIWIVDPEQSKEQKLDFDKEENKNVQAFTFGGKQSSSDNGPSFSNHISNNNRKLSITSPSLSARHSKSSNSITFSSTVSLYTDTEKRQNSLLFYDLWGIPATARSRADSDKNETSTQVTAVSSDKGGGHKTTTTTGTPSQGAKTVTTDGTPSQPSQDSNIGGHGHETSTSLSGIPVGSFRTHTPSGSNGYVISRKPSTLLTGPLSIKEDQAEEWSDFDLHHDNDDEDDSEDKTSLIEENEYVYDDDNVPQTELKKSSKKISGGFRYRKRKSTLTANFIFGRTGHNT